MSGLLFQLCVGNLFQFKNPDMTTKKQNMYPNTNNDK